MERKLSFVPKLSLEEMALRKLVTILWINKDVLSLIEKFPFDTESGTSKLWEERIEETVKGKISTLVIAEQFKRRMNIMVKPIGLQIPEWRESLRPIINLSKLNLDTDFLKQLQWTPAGAIDHEKTAEKLASLQTLPAEIRFKIACAYCLEDSIPAIWEELPEGFSDNFTPSFLEGKGRWSLRWSVRLCFYWAFRLKGEKYELFEGKVNCLSCFFPQQENLGSTKYFFHKCMDKERNYNKESLLFLELCGNISRPPFPVTKHNSKIKCFDVASFLLSQMYPQTQERVIRDHPGYIFRIFLNWQRHDLFLDNTDLIWTFPPDVDRYRDLLSGIGDKITSTDYYFPELFQEFFRRSSIDFKKFCVNQERTDPWNPFFTLFLEREDEETVKVILRSIDAKDRVRLLECQSVFKLLTNLLFVRKNSNLVELCIREACPDKEGREKLKRVYVRWTPMRIFVDDKKIMWGSFFESLNNPMQVFSTESGPEDDVLFFD